MICVNVETFAPPRLAAPVGSELWKTLTAYYLDQMEVPSASSYAPRRSTRCCRWW